jgi:hypothetical protein
MTEPAPMAEPAPMGHSWFHGVAGSHEGMVLMTGLLPATELVPMTGLVPTTGPLHMAEPAPWSRRSDSIHGGPVNLSSTIGCYRIPARWSMRPCESAPPFYAEADGLPRSHGPPEEELTTQKLTPG